MLALLVPLLQINDLGFEAVRDAETGKIWFNVVVGGLFSIKRNMMSIPLGCAVTEEQLIPFCLALLRVFRYDVSHDNDGLCVPVSLGQCS